MAWSPSSRQPLLIARLLVALGGGRARSHLWWQLCSQHPPPSTLRASSMAARTLLPLLLALAASQAVLGDEDVVTITGGQKELEALVKGAPFVAIEVRPSRRRRRWMDGHEQRAAAAARRAGWRLCRSSTGASSPSYPATPHRAPRRPCPAAVLRALVRSLQAAGA